MLNVDYKKVNREKALKLAFIIMGIGILLDVVLGVVFGIAINNSSSPIYLDGTTFLNPVAFASKLLLYLGEAFLFVLELIASVVAGIISFCSNQKKIKAMQIENDDESEIKDV